MSIELNPEQKEAVTYLGPKPLLIEAGPGSGKTRVLIERIKFLLNHGIEPSSMLIITFTKKAAHELKERLNNDNIAQSVINEMHISTIHSFCLKLLADSNINIFNIYDEKELIMFLSQHKKELGFTGEFYIPNSQLKDVVKKYDEYSLFDVDVNGLCDYIHENHPYSEEYADFVKREFRQKGKFPRKSLKYDKKVKKGERNLEDDWYDAKYFKIAESYPKFLKLLKRNNLSTYDLLQKEALNYLIKNPKTQYTNILIDEFQDTDPIQIQIFEILLGEILKNKGSFTVVGDADQKIYGFRGATGDYFEYLRSRYSCKNLALNYNYRSTDDIISISNNFIKHQRSKTSQKMLKGFREINKDSFYMITSSDKRSIKVSESENIGQLIKYLVDVKGLKYSDIAVLYRSLKNDSEHLVNYLKENNMPFQMSGLADLELKDEIQIILTLFYYIVDFTSKVPLRNSWSGKWLSLETLAESELINLSKRTSDILIKKQEEYEEDTFNLFKDMYLEEFGEKTRIRSFNGIFTNPQVPDEFIEKLFDNIEKPTLELSQLENWGITDENDLKFFEKFNLIRNQVTALPNIRQINDEEYLNEVKELFKEQFNIESIPTILDIFYEILELCGFLGNFQENVFKNIGRFSEILYEYETVVSKYDFVGLFWYLSSNLRDYESSVSKDKGVFLSTIHKSKGLEFPVVIVASIREGALPKEFTNPLENRFKNGSAIYYTPSEYLKHKNLTLDEEEAEHQREEERILYVAITRAEDIVILSINEIENQLPEIGQDLVENNDECLKELTLDNLDELPQIESGNVDNSGEKLDLSYTGLNDYQMCPLKYNLIYNYGFKQSDSEDISYGLIMHEIFNIINKELKDYGKMPNESEIRKIAEKSYHKEQNILHNSEELNSIVTAVNEYYEKIGSKIKVLESEYDFNIRKDSYNLKGAIDLLYETSEGKIGILDYKNSEDGESKKWKYEKQLSTYILALKNDAKYKDITVDEAKIYTMKDSNLIDIEINDTDNYNLNIDKAASKIENNNFKPHESAACDYCKFKFFCNK